MFFKDEKYDIDFETILLIHKIESERLYIISWRDLYKWKHLSVERYWSFAFEIRRWRKKIIYNCDI